MENDELKDLLIIDTPDIQVDSKNILRNCKIKAKKIDMNKKKFFSLQIGYAGLILVVTAIVMVSLVISGYFFFSKSNAKNFTYINDYNVSFSNVIIKNDCVGILNNFFPKDFNPDDYVFEYDDNSIEISQDGRNLILKAKKEGNIDVVVRVKETEYDINVYSYNNNYPTELPQIAKNFIKKDIDNYTIDGLHQLIQGLYFEEVGFRKCIVYNYCPIGIIFENSKNDVYFYTYNNETKMNVFYKCEFININEAKETLEEQNNNYLLKLSNGMSEMWQSLPKAYKNYAYINESLLSLSGLSNEGDLSWHVNLNEYYLSVEE